MSRCFVMVFLAIFSFVAVSCAPAPEEKPPAAEAETYSAPDDVAVRERDLPRHTLDITLDTGNHTIAGTDIIRFKAAEESAAEGVEIPDYLWNEIKELAGELHIRL